MVPGCWLAEVCRRAVVGVMDKGAPLPFPGCLLHVRAESVVDDGKVVSNWHCRAQLGDAKKSVSFVQFAPRYMGLKLVRSREHCAVWWRIDIANTVLFGDGWVTRTLCGT